MIYDKIKVIIRYLLILSKEYKRRGNMDTPKRPENFDDLIERGKINRDILNSDEKKFIDEMGNNLQALIGKGPEGRSEQNV
jgi:hypothetical protein